MAESRRRRKTRIKNRESSSTTSQIDGEERTTVTISTYQEVGKSHIHASNQFSFPILAALNAPSSIAGQTSIPKKQMEQRTKCEPTQRKSYREQSLLTFDVNSEAPK